MKRHVKVVLAAWAAVLIAGAITTGAGAATPPSLSDFQLRPATNQQALRDRVELLDSLLPKLGVQNILETAPENQVAKDINNPKATCRGALNGLKLDGIGYCFTNADNNTPEWIPQGVTTVADAQADQRWGSKKVILISWYHVDAINQVKGSRITFLDPDTLKYRHVLLVYPFINDSGNPSYMSLRTEQTAEGNSLHVGGISWYGNYLYVADTNRGFRVFDMRRIFDLGAAAANGYGNTTDKTQIGRQNGVYYGHGYQFVMPEVAAWTYITKPQKCSGRYCCTVGGGAKTSFTGLDRSFDDHLTSGEYCSSGQGTDRMGRVARWPLNSVSGEPLTNDGLWKADGAYRLPISNIQGAVSYNEKWYLNRSQGEKNGVLYVAKEPNSATGTLQIESAHRAGIGPEDLSYWPQPPQDRPPFVDPSRLYTVTEHAHKRMIYACDIGSLNDSTRDTKEICGYWSNPPH